MSKSNFKEQVLNIILRNLAIIAKDISFLYINNSKNIENIKTKELEK